MTWQVCFVAAIVGRLWCKVGQHQNTYLEFRDGLTCYVCSRCGQRVSVVERTEAERNVMRQRFPPIAQPKANRAQPPSASERARALEVIRS